MKVNGEYRNDMDRVIKHVPGIERLKGKKVFLTGCTGMLVSPVADILFHLNEAYGYGIRVILAARNMERTKKRFEGKDFEFVQYDATSSDPIDIDTDLIIHGASNANPAAYTKEPVETMLANTTGLKVLLDLARKNDARILYVSSSEVYGKKDNSDPFPEDYYGSVDILNPRACYPNAKRMAETMCVAYSEEYGIDPVIVRPGHIYGPTITESDSRATAQFTRKAANGEDIVMKSMGTQLRSYCYMLDCASAVLCVLLNGEKNTAYNISNPGSVCSIRDIAEALARAGNVKVVFDVPSDTEKKGYNLMDNSSLRSERLESLGWRAEFSLDEGAARTLRQF
ncbi:MAG: NAD-dependent epimerase/dehydratase family protein [Clostridiales bacterium]|nr:NAD-dependent epimerase/dehydratase family protein [Clostridiales bacterium]